MRTLSTLNYTKQRKRCKRAFILHLRYFTGVCALASFIAKHIPIGFHTHFIAKQCWKIRKCKHGLTNIGDYAEVQHDLLIGQAPSHLRVM